MLLVSSRYLFITVILSFLCCAPIENFCDGRKDKAQCYGALGGTVSIHVMGNLAEKEKFTWINPQKQSSRWPPRPESSSQRLEFISSNGTMRMNNLIKADDGSYTLQIHNINGERKAEWTLQLNIEGERFDDISMSHSNLLKHIT